MLPLLPPYGVKISPFYAQMVSERIFYNENLKKFCELEVLEMGSAEFPFNDVEEFCIIYIDDLLVHTLKELGLEAHLKVIAFVLLCVTIAGVKFSKKKAKILEPVIKWLGYEYHTDENFSGILAEHQSGFEKLRTPKLLAELNSRLGAFSYFHTYIPN